MKTIKILGQELNIAFNMAVQIAYEDITGSTFEVTELDKSRNAVALYYAAIVANNEGTTLTIDDLLKKATASDIATLRNAVIGSMVQWCRIPQTMASDEQPEEGEGEQRPNA